MVQDWGLLISDAAENAYYLFKNYLWMKKKAN